MEFYGNGNIMEILWKWKYYGNFLVITLTSQRKRKQEFSALSWTISSRDPERHCVA